MLLASSIVFVVVIVSVFVCRLGCELTHAFGRLLIGVLKTYRED